MPVLDAFKDMVPHPVSPAMISIASAMRDRAERYLAQAMDRDPEVFGLERPAGAFRSIFDQEPVVRRSSPRLRRSLGRARG